MNLSPGIFGKMYSWFAIRSRNNPSLVIPNKKTLEHWWLKVTFIVSYGEFGDMYECRNKSSTYTSTSILVQFQNTCFLLNFVSILFLFSAFLYDKMHTSTSIWSVHYPNTGQNIQQIIFYDLVFSPETHRKLLKLFLIFLEFFAQRKILKFFLS